VTGRDHGLTTFNADDPGHRVLRALCSTPDPHPVVVAALSGQDAVLGQVLAACVLTKTLCLLAAH
jgi:hypothetical protein